MAENGRAHPDPHGAIILAWLKYLGLASRELARRTGLDPAIVHRLVHGSHLSQERQIQIARALKISPEELDHMPPNRENGGEVVNRNPPPSPDGSGIDTSLRQLERLISMAVDGVIEEWSRREEQRVRRTQTEHEADMLRRILLRAGHSGPAEYPTRFTPYGERYSPVQGAEEIVRLAIRLVDAAAMTPPSDPDRNAIIITWRGATDPIGAVRDVYLRTQWIGAIRTALAREWDYIHCIQLFQDHRKALRSVLNVLALLGPSSRYKPRLLAPTEPTEQPKPDYLVVPGQGILVLYGSDMAHYYRPTQAQSFEQLYDTVSQQVAKSTPLYEQIERLSSRRSEALTLLEAAPGHRYLCMDGLPQNLVPESVHDERHKTLEKILRGRGARREELEVALKLARATLRSRKDCEQLLREQLDLKQYRHRDICPERAIQRFVDDGLTSLNNIDDTFSLLGAGDLPPLTEEQRRDCLTELVKRLGKFPYYELVLLPDGQAAISGTYCLIKAEQAVLLQFWKRRRGGANDNPREYIAIQITDPTVVQAFSNNPLLRPYDQELPKDNKTQVIAFLEKQIAVLKQRIAARERGAG